MEEKASKVFNLVADQMKSQAYSTPKTMMYETLVRSCELRYFMTHGYEQYKEYLIQYEESYGFVLVRMLVDVLEKREQQQAQYATLDDFMPEIIKAINDYQL